MFQDFNIKYFFKFTFVSFLVVILSVSYLNTRLPIHANDLFHSISFSFKNNDCNPYIVNATKFSIKIDGQIYPKSIPLSRSESIDYECLNKNKKVKLILLWNTFFSSEDFYFGLGKKDPFVRQE